MQVFNLTNLTFILTIASLYIIIKTLFLRIVKNNLEREKKKKKSKKVTATLSHNSEWDKVAMR